MRAILRDSKGEVIFTASIHENTFHNPKIIESLAMLRGLQLCLNLRIHHLVIESECQILVKELQSSELSSLSSGNIIQDLKFLMAWFSICSINFAYQQSNTVAYKFAGFTYNVETIILWYVVIHKFPSQTKWFVQNSICLN